MADQVATTELIIKLPSVMTAEYFTSEDEIEKLIAKVKAVADAHIPDLSTAKSRAATKSVAFQVSQTKAEIIRQGKKLTEGWRDQTKLVNTACNIFEERLDRLRDQVKKPVADWEKQEESRIDSHKARLDTLINYSKTGFGRSSADLKALIAEVKDVELGEGSWQEFASQASVASKSAIDTITNLLASAEKQEADAAELDRLRAAEAERVRQDGIRLAAEQAKQAEEERAERARVAEEQRKADLASAAAEATERSERESAARVAAAEQAVKDAERRANEAIAEAKVRAALEAETERQRIAAAKEAEDAEQRRRDASRAHRRKINVAIVAELIKCAEITEEQAQKIVTHVAGGFVPNVTLKY